MSAGPRGAAAPPSGHGSAPPPIERDPFPGPRRAALHAFYDLVWTLAIVLAAPWWLWRCARDRVFRAMVRGRLGLDLPPAAARGQGARVLVHGVSVGEVKAAQSIVRGLERELPGVEVLVSTTTATGIEVARRLYGAERVVRFPLDVSPVVRRFLRRTAPDCVVLVELEIWPNFLRAANRAGIPVAVVNGRITGDSYGRYRVFRRLLPQFDRISLVCVQDEEYARRFRALSSGGARILVSGNVKADGLETGARAADPELVRLLGGAPGQPVVVAGSTHEPEERLVAGAWLDGAARARLVLVPRHPERAPDVLRALQELGRPGQLLTALRAGEAPDPSRPAVVDTIGELEGVYALADLVFVGGSLVPHGGQNMLEPAAQGKPVLYGPSVENFLHESELLERAGASVRVAADEPLGARLRELLEDPERCAAMSRAGLEAVEAQKGATARTVEALLARCLPRATGGSPSPRGVRTEPGSN